MIFTKFKDAAELQALIVCEGVLEVATLFYLWVSHDTVARSRHIYLRTMRPKLFGTSGIKLHGNRLRVPSDCSRIVAISEFTAVGCVES